MTPYPFQQQAIEATLAGFKQFRRQLLVIPTGGGKTVIFSMLAKALQPERTLILAHREELIHQAFARLHAATGLVAGKEKAECSALPTDPVVVASVQTMIRRLDRWPSDHFGLIVADEAHHAVSDSWQTVLNHFSGRVLGVTATPDRGDKKDLGRYFENIPFEISLFDLIHQARLSRITVKALPIEIDLSRVGVVAGDYSEHDLASTLDPYLRQIARAIREHACFRKTLVFVPLIATSKDFVRICREEGILAEHIDGADRERLEKLRRFARGDYDLMSNAMLLTEGYDCPSVDCVVILRPTKSRALYSQMVGRGTRTAPAKSDLLLLDFLWMHETHSLVRPAHLISRTDDIASAMTRRTLAQGGQAELDLEELANDVQAEREEKLRQELEAKRTKQAKTIDAMDLALTFHSEELIDYAPAMKWEAEPMTHKQAALLAKWGIDLATVKGKGHASKLIDMLVGRSRLNLATPRQVWKLAQMGHRAPAHAQFHEASEFLGRRFRKKENQPGSPVQLSTTP